MAELTAKDKEVLWAYSRNLAQGIRFRLGWEAEDSGLPGYYLGEDEISSLAYEAFEEVASSYRPKADGTSLPTYCWKWGGLKAWDRIQKEWLRLCREVELADRQLEIDENGGTPRWREHCELSDGFDLGSWLETQDLLKGAWNVADGTERRIMLLYHGGQTFG